MSEDRRERFLRERRVREVNQRRDREIEALVSRGFPYAEYNLDPFDYTDDFKRVMRDWRKPDLRDTTEESLANAEEEINRILDDQEIVKVFKATGQFDQGEEVYEFTAKVGNFNPNIQILKNSTLIFNELNNFSVVSWIDNEGVQVFLREIEACPLKIKERFFNYHLI